MTSDSHPAPHRPWAARLGLGRPELRAWALRDCASSAALTSVVTVIFPIHLGQSDGVGHEPTRATRAYAAPEAVAP